MRHKIERELHGLVIMDTENEIAVFKFIEDIEILRFLELGIPVRMIDLPAGSLAVDHPSDVAPVERAMRAAGLSEAR